MVFCGEVVVSLLVKLWFFGDSFWASKFDTVSDIFLRFFTLFCVRAWR